MKGRTYLEMSQIIGEWLHTIFFGTIFLGHELGHGQELNLSCITVIFAFCGLLTYFEEVGHSTKCCQ